MHARAPSPYPIRLISHVNFWSLLDRPADEVPAGSECSYHRLHYLLKGGHVSLKPRDKKAQSSLNI